MADCRVTVAFSNHQIETLPLAEAHMRGHEVVVLEEPPSVGFADMLAGRLSVDSYLEELELEFPEFARTSCALWRRLAGDGLEFRQSDPYMEVLLSIHDLFERGGQPTDIDAESLMGAVYRMEKTWTAALLAFYTRSGSSDLDRVVAALQQFARADARRGRLRDQLRAAAIAELLGDFRRVYVEAGSLHLALLMELRTRLGNRARVRPVWIMEPITRPLAGQRQIIGPGDELTLRYAFRPGFSGPRADLLAARSLIHVKLLEKVEGLDTPDSYPHTRSELEARSTVASLSYADCRTLYPRVRSVASENARVVVAEYTATQGQSTAGI